MEANLSPENLNELPSGYPPPLNLSWCCCQLENRRKSSKLVWLGNDQWNHAVWKLLLNSCRDKSSINGFSRARQLKRPKMPISETRINFHNWKKIWMKNEVDTSSTPCITFSTGCIQIASTDLITTFHVSSVHAVHSSTCTTWRPCYTTQSISNTMNIDLQHLLYACITQIHTVPKRACIGPNHNHYLKITLL